MQIQPDITIHLLEWPKSRTPKTPNAIMDVEQQERSFIADENAKWYSPAPLAWWFLIILSMLLVLDPVVMLPGVYAKD